MISAFGVEHGEISKLMPPKINNAVKAVKAIPGAGKTVARNFKAMPMAGKLATGGLVGTLGVGAAKGIPSQPKPPNRPM